MQINSFLLGTHKGLEFVAAEELYLTIYFWILVSCCVRMIIYMRVHPAISNISDTFFAVGKELANFLVSFGIIFFFLGYIAFIR